jgi:hypothetical protein
MLPVLAAASLVLLSAHPVLSQPYEETVEKNALVERLVYSELQKYRGTIDRYCELFGVDPVTVYCILYVEKVQYELDIFRRAKREIEKRLISYVLFTENLVQWAQLSVGYTHIKPRFARETKARLDRIQGYEGFLTELEVTPSHYIKDPEAAIKIAVAGLFLLQNQWSSDPNGVDIGERPGILATLFCLGYEKSLPKKNPSLGGSCLPVIIDGRLVENRSFGEKVEMIYHDSVMMRAFRDGELLSTLPEESTAFRYGMRDSR